MTKLHAVAPKTVGGKGLSKHIGPVHAGVNLDNPDLTAIAHSADKMLRHPEVFSGGMVDLFRALLIGSFVVHVHL